MPDAIENPKQEVVHSVPALPTRADDAHKGSCGRILIAGGSRGMAGAPCLAARAALRGGAGLVKVAVPCGIWDIVAIKLDECLTAGLPETANDGLSTRALKPLNVYVEWADVVVLGPGLGVAKQTVAFLRQAVDAIAKPHVLDADGLNAFHSGHVKMLGAIQKRLAPRPLILTPHPGEMARLLQTTVQDVQSRRQEAALDCAQRTHGIVILKGAGTIVTDGTRIFINKTGNSGMASGGTGDVLAGLLGALLGQGMNGFEAACLGVCLHGLAGDLAAKRLGRWSLIANDLIDELPNAFLRWQQKNME